MTSLSLRLPADAVAELGPDGVREVLDTWAASGGKLDPPGRKRSKVVQWSLEPPTLAALEAEAERLTRETGKRWTVGSVAAEILRGRKNRR